MYQLGVVAEHFLENLDEMLLKELVELREPGPRRERRQKQFMRRRVWRLQEINVIRSELTGVLEMRACNVMHQVKYRDLLNHPLDCFYQVA